MIIARSLSLAVIFLPLFAAGQSKTANYFGDPIITDSTSTVMIPTRYSDEFLSTNKLAMGGGYYANIIFYNFVTDSSKTLFPKDAYIESVGQYNYTTRSYDYSS